MLVSAVACCYLVAVLWSTPRISVLALMPFPCGRLRLARSINRLLLFRNQFAVDRWHSRQFWWQFRHRQILFTIRRAFRTGRLARHIMIRWIVSQEAKFILFDLHLRAA